MMILRCAALLAAGLTLSNCCSSSSGCNGPVALTAAAAPAAPSPIAAAQGWDGINEQPAAEAEPAVDVTPSKKQTRRRPSVDAMSSQSSAGSRELSWEDMQAADQAEDARLKQKLIICRDCAGSR